MSTLLQVRRIARLTGHEASVFAIGAGPDHRHFLSGAGDGWVVRWDLEDPEMGRLIAKVETQIFSLLYLPESRRVVVGNMNGGVHWVDLEQPDHTRNIAHHQKGVFDLLRAGDHVFSAGGGGLITRWSIEESRALESLQLSNQSLRSLDYCPHRGEIAVGASDNNIYFLDADTLALKRTLTGAHDNSVFTVKYTPDGRHLLSGGRDAHLRLWDLEQGAAPLAAQPAHWFTLNHIAFAPDGRWFATASRDKTIKLWDASDFQLLKVLNTARDGGHVNSVNRLFWSPYRNYLISGGDDRSMIVWEVGEKS